MQKLLLFLTLNKISIKTQQTMIPGKVFFQSIKISQHLSSKYSVYLLLNGIFYDQIKPFQTKYMCLTVNDLIQVQFCLHLDLQNEQEKQNNSYKYSHHLISSPKNPITMKVAVPQSFRLMIQNKNIQLKFYLKENQQDIKIGLLFEPVASFSRKKLAASLNSPLKTIKKTQLSHQLNENSQQNHQIQRFGSSLKNPLQTEVKKDQTNTNIKISPLKMLSTLNNKSSNNSNFDIFSQTYSNPNKIRTSRITYNQIFPLNQNQIDKKTERSNNEIVYQDNKQDKLDNQNISNNNQSLISRNDQPNSVNLNKYFSQKSSQLDTLESLAYQREKILGQLFGKFNKNYK